jgi:hypothetical protein
MTNELTAAPFTYARLGYGVFPCKAGDKHPITRHGLKDATLEPQRLQAWWQATPAANIGLLPPEGVLVIDVDAPDLVALPH